MAVPSLPHQTPQDPDADCVWQQGKIVEVAIADLSDRGDGVGRYQERVVFVPNTVPGDRLLARLIRVKPRYAHGQLHTLLEASPHRVQPSCIVADKCGGCQLQTLSYPQQLAAKENKITQALAKLGGFSEPPIAPILAAPSSLGYRNKATYPLGRSTTGQVQAGYYRKGSHRLVNLNQCPVQDPRLNSFLSEIKQTIQQQGWSIYNESSHRGNLRHLGLRIGRRTGEVLLTLVGRESFSADIEEQAALWLDRYPELVGVVWNHNPERTNTIFGSTSHCLAGRPYLEETFAGLTFRIDATSFFQIYTEQAELLLRTILSHLNLQGTEFLVDAYCGIGTLTLPLAKHSQHVLGIELQPEAIALAQGNASLNGLTNVIFQTGAVASVLEQLTERPDIVLLDPPRRGCDRAVIHQLQRLSPPHIIYVSCKPATLARDLQILAQAGYQLTKVQPADFFPQTAHVEAVAFLSKTGGLSS